MEASKVIRKKLLNGVAGYGLMGLTWRKQPLSKEAAFAAMNNAIEMCKGKGIMFNCGEFYGEQFINLHYVRDFFAKYPEKRKEVIISVKGGMNNTTLQPTGDTQSVIRSMDNCIKEVGVFIDIYECARLDKTITKEGDNFPRESFDIMARYVREGKIGSIGLSEVTADEINSISKEFGDYLSCVEVEFSPLTLDNLKNGVLEACNEQCIPVICYSPLGRGLLTGSINSLNDLPEGDFRKNLIRFNGEAFLHNRLIVEFFRKEIIEKVPLNLKPVHVSLAWIKSWEKVYPNTKFIPIPGGTTPAKMQENFMEYDLTDDQLKEINNFLAHFTPAGGRYEFQSG